jgi:hypothetical protein
MNKLTKKAIKPTMEQINHYNSTRKGMVTRNTNCRFGKIVLTTDQDLDG